MKKLNTKNCCFLCLQSNRIKIEDQNGNGESVFHRKSKSLLRCLVRHLRINFNEFEDDSSNSNIPNQDDTDVEVDLCEDCAQLNTRFSKLFLQLKKIQMEMSFYLEGINHRILESSKNPELVQKYSMEMTSDRETLTLLAFVDKLRKEIADKSLRLVSVNPRVCLTPTELTNVVLVKPEADVEDFDDHNSDGYNPTEDPLEQSDNCFTPVPKPDIIEDCDNIDDFEDSNADGCSPISEDSPEQLDIGLSLELKPEVTCEIQEEKDSVPSKVGDCYSKNVSTGRYHCTVCKKEYKRAGAVIVHYKIVHLNQRLNCDRCSRPFSQAQSLKKHKTICKGDVTVGIPKKNVYYTRDGVTGMLQCTKCEKKCSEYTTIISHYEAKHLRKRYRCDICNNQEFAYQTSLIIHKKKCTGTPSTVEDNFIMKVVGDQIVFGCKLCEKCFPTKIRLGAHIRKVHRNTDRYPCDLCEKKFKTQQNLNMHLDQAHLGKRFDCRFCGKYCRNKYKQKYHERDCLLKNQVKKPKINNKTN